MIILSKSLKNTMEIGENVGKLLVGGEILELVGDVGAGKTSFVKGLAYGLGVSEVVQSPSFTISRTYEAKDNLNLVHYDFYRLSDAGLMKNELMESIADNKNVIVIEWSDLVGGILTSDRLIINIQMISENDRQLTIEAGGSHSQKILEELNV